MIHIDSRDKRPIYEQITERLTELMLCGVLKKDEQLPSVRSLAMELSINPNTIQRAYIELERSGYIYSVKGKGSFVAELDGIRRAMQKGISDEILTIFKKARQAGLAKQRIIEMAEEVYKGEGDEK